MSDLPYDDLITIRTMIKKIYQGIKWGVILVLGVSIIITAITLFFDDYDLELNKDLGKIPDPATMVRDSELDHLIDQLLVAHQNETGLVLLSDNLEAFAMRAITARTATRTLDLQYYIWNHDLTGKLLGHEVLKAADRGVHVRILLDDLNSMDRDSMFRALAEHPNIHIRLFNPVYTRRNFITRRVEFLFRGLSLNRRMHNKAWIVDDNIAIIGGRNIGDEYFDASPYTNFFDVDVLLAGMGVTQTRDIFNQFWQSAAVRPFTHFKQGDKGSLTELKKEIQNITDDNRHLVDLYIQQIAQSPTVKELFNGKRDIHWTAEAHVYSDPPEKVFDQGESEWLLNYITPSWERATEELYLVSPYFVPGKGGVEQLTNIQQRGVDVKILTNSLAATDVLMVHSGYAPYRKPLLKAGIDIYELLPYSFDKKSGIGVKGKSLHTKIYTIDNDISFIGSYNLDPRSARLNTEMGILFREENITQALKDLYLKRIGPNNSYHLYLEENRLRWEDLSLADGKIWNHEPETSLLTRMMSKIISWLPIESQL